MRFAALPLRVVATLAIVLSFVLTSVLPAFAVGGVTGNVSGSVIDAASKTPVVGANVTLAAPTGTYRARTDANGRFTFNGVNVDSYTLTIEAQGFQTVQQTGLTIQGDQTLNLQTISISKQLRTIGRVTSRSAGGAFQPSQTTDSYTVTGPRVQEALGKAVNTDERQLLLSVPGATLTNGGNVTVRGGLSNETGYQLDGVPFTEPFLTTNASNDRINGLGSLQVVEGAGDATQGNIGSGVVNIVPKRGTYPGNGLFDLELGSPSFNHQLGIEYGIATRTGSVSNYFSYVGERDAPYYGYFGQNVAYGVTRAGANPFLGGTSLQSNDNIIDNFVFKFGKDNRQSLQVLYNTLDLQDFGQVGGLTGRYNYLSDPYVLAHGAAGPNPFSGGTATAAGDAALFANYVGLTPYANLSGKQLTQSIVNAYNPTSLLKFEYDNNLDDKTYLALRYYNFNSLSGTNSDYSSNANPSVSVTGGQRVGGILELTRSIGRHTLTLQGQLENQKPIWNDYAPLETLSILGVGGTSLSDFLPAAVNTSLAQSADPTAPAQGDGWVYQHLGQTRIPTAGINYNGADFQTLGAGLRDQWSITDRVKLDYGVRVDHANYKFGRNPYNPDLGNPSDVPPSFITSDILRPTEVEPRIALSLQPTSNDGIRLSYGRSTEFLNAQTAGTPGGIYGADALLNVPPTPKTNTADPATWTCGSGLNPARILPSGLNKGPGGGGFFRCTNYAQQLYWAYDQNFDAPDVGNGRAPTYSNYDATYTHGFKNGFGLKATGFYRLSTGLPGFFVLSQTTDPATGAILFQVFSVNNNAIQRTTGLEFQLTTPERPVGFSGYLSATYQNAISSIPPLLPGEDQLPLVTSQSFALGNTYRAGFLAPVSFNLGGAYRTRGGLSILPNIQFNAGYPTGVGNLVAYNGFVNGKPYNVMQSNLGGSQPTANGYQGTTGQQVATNYVDPAYPGSILNPNIAASRGVAEKSSAGGLLTNPYFTANIGAEYKIGKRNTLGVLVRNVTGQIYAGHIPVPNTYYQPVTTGVAGPATGFPRQANPAQTSYANHGYVGIPNSAYGQSPSLLFPNQPTTYRLYYQLGL